MFHDRPGSVGGPVYAPPVRRPATSIVVALLVTTAGISACGDGGTGAGAAESAEARPGAGSEGPSAAGATEAPVGGSEPGGGLAGSDASAPTNPEPAGPEAQVVELTYAGGQVTSGAGRVTVAAGAPVRLEVTSDVDEEVHVHGYDLEVPVAAGSTATIELVGDLPGVWEVELHDSGRLLCELEIAG